MSKFILIHIILSFLYSLIFFKRNKDESIYKFMVVLLIPILGFVYIIALTILNSFNKNSSSNFDNDTFTDYMDLNLLPIKNINYSKDVNVVPIEEALILNEKSVKRGLIREILKGNPLDYIPVLKKALADEDSETSHYAASALSEIKSKFYIEVQKASIAYENNKLDLTSIRAYVDILKEYIESNLLDSNNCRKYKYTLSLALEDLLSIYKSNEQYYINKINCDLELAELMKAKEYCTEFSKEYPNSEWAYLMNMKLFYTISDKKNFYNTLDILKNSNIKLSNEALNIIRFWLEGE